MVGLSILSGSHLPLVEDVVGRMKEAGLDVPVVVGGIIPPEDAAELEKAGVAAVYTPKDFELNRIMSDVVRIVERANGPATSSRSWPSRQRLRQLAGAHRLAEIEIHAGGARGRFVAAFAAPGNADDRHLACVARQRANAARRFDAVETAEHHIHQHGVVAAARDRRDSRLAGLDEIDAMAEFGAESCSSRRGRRDCPRRRESTVTASAPAADSALLPAGASTGSANTVSRKSSRGRDCWSPSDRRPSPWRSA